MKKLKKSASQKTETFQAGQNPQIILALNQAMEQVINETFTLRREVLQRLQSGERDIDKECGYPPTISTKDYKEFFDRHGLAERVVKLWPEESWQKYPEIYETEDPKETDFEKQVKTLTDGLPIWNMLYRADVLSGIGQFGIILLGINDGKKDLKEEAEFVKDSKKNSRQLIYLHPLDQSVVTIKKKVTDTTNPRYGKPEMYSVTFEADTAVGGTIQHSGSKVDVHWTRVVHLADNRTTSDIYGVPRMMPLYNNLLDVKKISAGSGEMFWKGGFPGFGLSLSPEAQKVGAEITDETKKSMKEEVYKYFEGLQRYMLLTGIEIKSLQPQAVDPSGHLEWHIKLIAMNLGVPYRKLLGTEEAKLASTQDERTWNKRVAKRQNNYLTPMVVRPFFDRLIDLGILIKPEEYFVTWPDLDMPNEKDIAEVAAKITEALGKYATTGADQVMPLRLFLTMVLKYTEDEAEAIVKELKEQENEMESEPESELVIEEPVVEEV